VLPPGAAAALSTLSRQGTPLSLKMGLWFSSIFSSLFGRREIRVLILGLDNAGKTTILCAWTRSRGGSAWWHRAAAPRAPTPCARTGRTPTGRVE
jgi:hypothetical protein